MRHASRTIAAYVTLYFDNVFVDVIAERIELVLQLERRDCCVLLIPCWCQLQIMWLQKYPQVAFSNLFLFYEKFRENIFQVYLYLIQFGNRGMYPVDNIIKESSDINRRNST